MKRHRLIALLVCLAAPLAGARAEAQAPQDPAGAPAIATRDFVVVPVPLPPMETPQGPTPQPPATLNWSTGVLRVSGRGWPKPGTTAVGQRIVQARKAAQNEALRNLAFALSGAPVTSSESFRDYVRRQGGRVEISAVVRINRVVNTRDLPDGSAETTVELDLRQHPQVSSTLFGQAAAPAKAVSFKPQSRGEETKPPAGATPTDDRGPYTGLIVLANGLETLPVLRPSLLNAAGKPVYGPGVATAESALRDGLAAYAASLEGATALGRAGKHPLVITATAVNARSRGDLILSNADAERVRQADRAAGFLPKAAVVIVIDPPAEE